MFVYVGSPHWHTRLDEGLPARTLTLNGRETYIEGLTWCPKMKGTKSEFLRGMFPKMKGDSLTHTFGNFSEPVCGALASMRWVPGAFYVGIECQRIVQMGPEH